MQDYYSFAIVFVNKIGQMLVFFALGYLIWAIALFNSASLHFDERTEFSNENPPNYSGIFANAPGYESSNETRLIMVHGIGKHCIGYSDELVRGVLAERGVTKVPRYDDWLDGGLALAHDEYIEMRDSMSTHFEYQPRKISKSRGRIHWPKAKGLTPYQRDIWYWIKLGPLVKSGSKESKAALKRIQEDDGEGYSRLLRYQEWLENGFRDGECGEIHMSRGPKHRSSKVLNIDSYHSLDFEGSQRHTCDLIEMYRVDLTPKKGILRRCVPIILPLKIELPKSDGGKVCYWSEDSNRTRDTVNFECKLTLATLGYMMVTTYDLDQIGRIKKGAGPETINPRFLTVYELTWDSATRGIKERYMDESLSGEGFGNISPDFPDR